MALHNFLRALGSHLAVFDRHSVVFDHPNRGLKVAAANTSLPGQIPVSEPLLNRRLEDIPCLLGPGRYLAGRHAHIDPLGRKISLADHAVDRLCTLFLDEFERCGHTPPWYARCYTRSRLIYSVCNK